MAIDKPTSSDNETTVERRPLWTIRTKREWFALVTFLVVHCIVFVYAASVQMKHLNLSAAAGGQMPYLEYAKHIAEEGMPAWYGDHNRMPLVPSLLSVWHTDHWSAFVQRSKWFSVAMSTLILLAVSFLAFYVWPSLVAAAFCAIFAFTVLLSRASFVQAELPYYGLSFFSWLMLCRLLSQPTIKLAVVAGLTLGLAYLTKASAWPMLPAYIFIVLVRHIYFTLRKQHSNKTKSAINSVGSWRYVAVATLMFFVTVWPYVWHNYQQFGRPFYNVNSTFFMWCDSWSEAKAFADANPIGDSYPDATSDTIPSAGQYVRSHTIAQMWARWRYGLSTLFQLAYQGAYTKYLMISVGFCCVMTWRLRRGLDSMIKVHGSALLFSAVCFTGYLLVYAWYVPVAYGDRFILSLITPLLFGTLWIPFHLSRHQSTGQRPRNMTFWMNSLSVALLGLLMFDSLISIRKTLYEPTRQFVRFYYNESRELLSAGNLAEASRGLRGVAQLDPDFAQARLDLGMLALTNGQVREAIRWLREAVSLDSLNADMWNSLGSAYMAADELYQGIEAFQRAVDLDPTFAIAWYNLGGAHSSVGSSRHARAAYDKLLTLDKKLAGQLHQLIPDETSPVSAP